MRPRRRRVVLVAPVVVDPHQKRTPAVSKRRLLRQARRLRRIAEAELAEVRAAGAAQRRMQHYWDATQQQPAAAGSPADLLVVPPAAGPKESKRAARRRRKAELQQLDQLNLEDPLGGDRYHWQGAAADAGGGSAGASPPQAAPGGGSAAAAAPAAPPRPAANPRNAVQMAEVRLMLRALPEEEGGGEKGKDVNEVTAEGSILSSGPIRQVPLPASGFSVWSGRGRHLASGVTDVLGPAPATVGLRVLVYRNGVLVEPDDACSRIAGKKKEDLKAFLPFATTEGLVAELHTALTADPSPPPPEEDNKKDKDDLDGVPDSEYMGARRRLRLEKEAKRAEERRKWEEEQESLVPGFITRFVEALPLRLGGGKPHVKINFVDKAKETLREADQPQQKRKPKHKARSGTACALPPFGVAVAASVDAAPSTPPPEAGDERAVVVRLRGAGGAVRRVVAAREWTLRDLRAHLGDGDRGVGEQGFAAVAPFRLLSDDERLGDAVPARGALLQLVPLPPRHAVMPAPPAPGTTEPRQRRAWWPAWITTAAPLVATGPGRPPQPVLSPAVFPWLGSAAGAASPRSRRKRPRAALGAAARRAALGFGTKMQPFDADTADSPKAAPAGMSLAEAEQLAKRRRAAGGGGDGPFPRWEDDSDGFKRHWREVLEKFKAGSKEGARLEMPTLLTPKERYQMHELAEAAGLRHESEGQGAARRIVVSNLPPLPPKRPKPVYCGVSVDMHRAAIGAALAQGPEATGSWAALEQMGVAVPAPLHVTTYFRTEMDDAMVDTAERLSGQTVGVQLLSLVVGSGGIVVAAARLAGPGSEGVPVPAGKLLHVTLGCKDPWRPADSNDLLKSLPGKGLEKYSGQVTVLDRVTEVDVVPLDPPLQLAGTFYRHTGARAPGAGAAQKKPAAKEQASGSKDTAPAAPAPAAADPAAAAAAGAPAAAAGAGGAAAAPAAGAAAEGDEEPLVHFNQDTKAFEKYWNKIMDGMAPGERRDCPAGLSPADRAALHRLAGDRGYQHVSEGQDADRHIVLTRPAAAPASTGGQQQKKGYSVSFSGVTAATPESEARGGDSGKPSSSGMKHAEPIYTGVSVDMHSDAISKLLADSTEVSSGLDELRTEGFTVPSPLHITTYFRREMDDAVRAAAAAVEGRAAAVRILGIVTAIPSDGSKAEAGSIVVATADIVDQSVPRPERKLLHVTLATMQPWVPKDSNALLEAIPGCGKETLISEKIKVLEREVEVTATVLPEPLELVGGLYSYFGEKAQRPAAAAAGEAADLGFPRHADDPAGFEAHWNAKMAAIQPGGRVECPAGLTGLERKQLHALAEQQGLTHKSEGQVGADRKLVLGRPSDAAEAAAPPATEAAPAAAAPGSPAGDGEGGGAAAAAGEGAADAAAAEGGAARRSGGPAGGKRARTVQKVVKRAVKRPAAGAGAPAAKRKAVARRGAAPSPAPAKKKPQMLASFT